MNDTPQNIPANEPPYLYLTTTGRKSGLPREIEIWFVTYADKYYLCAENRERADWVKNILASPTISWRVGSREAELIHGVGRIVDAVKEPDLSAQVSAKLDAKFQWSNGLLVELAPNDR